MMLLITIYLVQLLHNVYTIEFQKRGLPHCHILLKLDALCKPKSPDDYDKYVAPEIPNQLLAPELYQIVIQHMVNGPCGQHK